MRFSNHGLQPVACDWHVQKMATAQPALYFAADSQRFYCRFVTSLRWFRVTQLHGLRARLASIVIALIMDLVSGADPENCSGSLGGEHWTRVAQVDEARRRRR